MNSLRRFFTTFISTSEPICGFASVIIALSAPNRTKFSRTNLLLPSLSFTRVFNLPSEKVPAPPSPNCTFDSLSRAFPCQKDSIVSLRLSASSPLSITRGFNPAFESKSAANIPAGPNPTITGLSIFSRSAFSMGSLYSFSLNIETSFDFERFTRISSFSAVKRTE